MGGGREDGGSLGEADEVDRGNGLRVRQRGFREVGVQRRGGMKKLNIVFKNKK